MDNGHGLVDRFLLAIPPAFRPLPEEEKECNRILQEGNLNSIGGIYEHILNLHNYDITYYFENDADEILEKLPYEHIQQINEALQNGDCTPQTKKCDIIPRLAVGIHVFQHVTQALLAGNDVQPIQQGIEKKTLERAIDYCSYLYSQKEIFLAFLASMTSDQAEHLNQPTATGIRQGVLHFPGPFVSARGFKQAATSRLRSTSNKEFLSAINVLANEGKGTVVNMQIPRHATKAAVFVKKTPAELPCVKESNREAYEARFKLPIQKAISNAMKIQLRAMGNLHDDD